MATTDLELEETGTIQPPGYIGRIVRFLFGYVCLWYVYQLALIWPELVNLNGFNITLMDGVIPPLILVSYVVNIGWSRSWKKYPLFLSLLIFILVGSYQYFSNGIIEGFLLANVIYWWMLYVYLHLGISFVLSALIATPGCEMRALHHLYSKLTGKSTKEHQCPIGPLSAIDRWEAGRKK